MNKHVMKGVQDYLSEFVYGGMDGSITTFAVVAGATGAGMESSVIIILGFANVIADGFSMSVGSYLSAKSQKQQYERHRQKEYWAIEHLREKEIQDIREIFEGKGFEGELLENVVKKVTENNDHWVDIMMKHELEMVPENRTTAAIGAATFSAFVITGFIPLFIYVIDIFHPLDVNLFVYSTVLTMITFICIGLLKSFVTKTSRLKGVIETLSLGAAAAVLAYIAGTLLESMLL